jgi:hypothetical protein
MLLGAVAVIALVDTDLIAAGGGRRASSNGCCSVRPAVTDRRRSRPGGLSVGAVEDVAAALPASGIERRRNSC